MTSTSLPSLSFVKLLRPEPKSLFLGSGIITGTGELVPLAGSRGSALLTVSGPMAQRFNAGAGGAGEVDHEAQTEDEIARQVRRQIARCEGKTLAPETADWPRLRCK